MIGHNKKQQGFTLVELLIYIGILAFVITDLVSFTITIINIKDSSKLRATTGSSAAQSMDIMVEGIKKAAGVLVPAKGLGSNELRLRTTDNGEAVFRAEEGRLIYEVEGNASAITDSRTAVKEIKFNNLSSGNERDCINIELVISSKNARGSGSGHDTNLSTMTGVRK